MATASIVVRRIDTSSGKLVRKEGLICYHSAGLIMLTVHVLGTDMQTVVDVLLRSLTDSMSNPAVRPELSRH